MGLSTDFFFRIIGAVGLGLGGAYVGARLADLGVADGQLELFILVFGLLGILAGLILTPFFTSRPLRKTRDSLFSMPSERLVAIMGGIFLGLIAA